MVLRSTIYLVENAYVDFLLSLDVNKHQGNPILGNFHRLTYKKDAIKRKETSQNDLRFKKKDFIFSLRIVHRIIFKHNVKSKKIQFLETLINKEYKYFKYVLFIYFIFVYISYLIKDTINKYLIPKNKLNSFT